MLTEYNKDTCKLISCTRLTSENEVYIQTEVESICTLYFVDLPETSYACYVMEKTKVDEIWAAHIAGQEITLLLDELGCFEDAIILPLPELEPEPTIEEGA